MAKHKYTTGRADNYPKKMGVDWAHSIRKRNDIAPKALECPHQDTNTTKQSD